MIRIHYITKYETDKLFGLNRHKISDKHRIVEFVCDCGIIMTLLSIISLCRKGSDGAVKREPVAVIEIAPNVYHTYDVGWVFCTFVVGRERTMIIDTDIPSM